MPREGTLIFVFIYTYIDGLIDSMLTVTPIVGFSNCSMYCCALFFFNFSFAIISMGKRELVALLCLSSWTLVSR